MCFSGTECRRCIDSTSSSSSHIFTRSTQNGHRIPPTEYRPEWQHHKRVCNIHRCSTTISDPGSLCVSLMCPTLSHYVSLLLLSVLIVLSHWMCCLTGCVLGLLSQPCEVTLPQEVCPPAHYPPAQYHPLRTVIAHLTVALTVAPPNPYLTVLTTAPSSHCPLFTPPPSLLPTAPLYRCVID